VDKQSKKGAENMRTRLKPNEASIEVRLLDIDELRIYTNLGRNNAMKLGEEIGAERRIGRRVLYDKRVVDRYFDGQIEGV